MVVYTRIHLVIVSIHTPTQGVTTSIMYPAQASQFQSTHPRRVWLIYHFLHFRTECFNPHTHAGCDAHCLSEKIYNAVSIHTPTQGVTFIIDRSNRSILFQSTHPRRVWHYASSTRSGIWCFNPHTHAGCDIRYRLEPWHITGLNPHTHAGCDSISNNIL